MWSRKELKKNAKASLRNFMGKAILAVILVALLGVPVEAIRNTINNQSDDIVNNLRGQANVSLYTQDEDGNVIADYSNSIGEPDEDEEKFSGVLRLFNTSPLLKFYNYLGKALAAIPGISMIIAFYNYLFLEPVKMGLNRFFMKSRSKPTGIDEIFSLLRNFARLGGAAILKNIKIVLWMLLLVIPGIIKIYEYRMVNYILAENPDMNIKRAFQISKTMTDGNKWNLFVLDLSFILWNIACLVCFPVYLYVLPYMNATKAEAYYKLKADAVVSGRISLLELPDIA